MITLEHQGTNPVIHHVKVNGKTIMTLHIGHKIDVTDESQININIQPHFWGAGYIFNEIHFQPNNHLHVGLFKRE